MGFNHENGHEAIRFDAAGVSGAPAVDGYLLRFSIAYQVSSWRGEFGDAPQSFHNIQARAELGPGRVRLGRPLAEVPLIITPYDNAQNGTVMFESLLPSSTIDKIEAHRAGGDMEIFLQLAGERVGATHPQYDDVLFRISQSQWIDVLKQMDYGVHLLCEIPIELGEDSELREVWASMKRAQELLYAGHLNNVVLECRKALETALVHFDLKARIQSATKTYRGSLDERKSMSKQERIFNLVNAANHVAQLGAHPDTNNLVVDYSRREALLVFSVVAAAIAEISDKHSASTNID